MYDIQFLFVFVSVLTTFAILHLGNKLRDRRFYLVAMLGSLYIFGEVIQYLHMGPGWIRWHMSDVGWVSWFTIIITAVVSKLLPDIDVLGLLRKMLWIPFLGGVVMELTQMYLAEKDPGVLSESTVRGDVIDIIIFTVTFVANLLLLKRIATRNATPP